MKHFKRLKDFLIRNKWSYILGIVWLLIVDILQLLVPEILRKFTDDLVSNNISTKSLFRYGLYIVLIGIGIAFFRFLWRIYIIGTSRKLEYELRNKLFIHLQTLSTSYFNTHKTGDLMAHATNDINAVRMALGPGIVMMTDAIFMTAIAIGMMSKTTDIRLTFFALIPLPFLAFAIWMFGKKINSRFKSVQEAFSTLTDTVQENFAGIRVIKSFVQEEAEIEKFNEKNILLLNKNMSLVKLFGMFHPFIQFMASMSFLIAIFYGSTLVIYGQISLGDFVAFNSYLALLVWPMMALGWVINMLQRGAVSMERINKILDEEPEIIDSLDAFDIPNFKGELVFDNVSFHYPNADHNALENLSFRIPSGSSLGIIGKTGSGKTTIISLLLRLFENQKGNILLDGHKISDVKLQFLRKNIGYVDQDSFLFSTTLENNIGFGVDKFTLEDVEYMAKVAQVHDNIVEFPLGYQTYVGERGVTLSGGQKQRTSIARALIKRPQILVFDDSLSAVDTHTEEKILEGLKREMNGKTTILIAHRISTIKDCDEIIVLDEGKIIERGNHHQLLQNKNLYYDFYQKQLLEDKIANE